MEDSCVWHGAMRLIYNHDGSKEENISGVKSSLAVVSPPCRSFLQKTEEWNVERMVRGW